MSITAWGIALITISLALSAGVSWTIGQIRTRHLDCWLIPFLAQSCLKIGRGVGRGETVHLLLCVADHFEPEAEGAITSVAHARVQRWVHDYPERLGEFRDSDGRPPRHTFFYPIETYIPDDLDALATLCRQGYGEVEIHLHHDGDTPDNLHTTLENACQTLANRHGLLARDGTTGAVAYAFIHGNWALNNSHPDGCHCGVNNELDVLRDTGCYADFTMPSAPSPTQTRTINSLYYSRDDPGRPKSHDRGVAVGTGPQPAGSLMLIQGPLVLDWHRRKWGLIPRIENGCVQESQLPRIERVDLWLRARLQVPTRPDWFFVKLHAHGAPESGQRALLGEHMVEFHRALARRAGADQRFHYHYVTAREMYNLIRAAEAGWTGSVAEARDFALTWGGGLPATHDCKSINDTIQT